MDNGKAEPSLAAPMLAEGARRHGATIHQDCAARGLDVSNGAVTGVLTEKGLIRASAVLCAGGAWASPFCRRHGVSFPQASVRCHRPAHPTRSAPAGSALHARLGADPPARRQLHAGDQRQGDARAHPAGPALRARVLADVRQAAAGHRARDRPLVLHGAGGARPVASRRSLALRAYPRPRSSTQLQGHKHAPGAPAGSIRPLPMSEWRKPGVPTSTPRRMPSR